MPIAFEIDRERRRVHAVCTGDISADELMNYQVECWINAGTYGYDCIFDACEGRFEYVDFATMLDFSRNAAAIDRHAPPSRIALVIRTTHQQQLVDFYLSALRLMPGDTAREARVFGALDQALAWLDGSDT